MTRTDISCDAATRTATEVGETLSRLRNCVIHLVWVGGDSARLLDGLAEVLGSTVRVCGQEPSLQISRLDLHRSMMEDAEIEKLAELLGSLKGLSRLDLRGQHPASCLSQLKCDAWFLHRRPTRHCIGAHGARKLAGKLFAPPTPALRTTQS